MLGRQHRARDSERTTRRVVYIRSAGELENFMEAGAHPSGAGACEGKNRTTSLELRGWVWFLMRHPPPRSCATHVSDILPLQERSSSPSPSENRVRAAGRSPEPAGRRRPAAAPHTMCAGPQLGPSGGPLHGERVRCKSYCMLPRVKRPPLPAIPPHPCMC